MPEATKLHLNGDFDITIDGPGGPITLIKRIGSDLHLLPQSGGALNYLTLGWDGVSSGFASVHMGNGQVSIPNLNS